MTEAGRPSDLAELRASLVRNGYLPIPVFGPRVRCNSPGKQPAHREGWQKVRASEAAARDWSVEFPSAINTGILAGEIVGIDIDILEPGVAAAVIARAQTMARSGAPLVRYGRKPKALVLFRAAERFRKKLTPEYRLDDGTKAQVEILADGQQFVAFGVHPETNAPYSWEGGRSPAIVGRDELPAIGAADLDSFMEDAKRMIEGSGGVAPQKAAPPPPTPPKTVLQPARIAGGDFFANVNRAALDDIGTWVPRIFPSAKQQPGTNAWRVASSDLGRPLEEDLSIHPEGIRDFGEERSLSPIDVAMQWGGAPDAKAAAIWLCAELGVDPKHLGFADGKAKAKERAEARAEARASTAAAGTPVPDTEDAMAQRVADEFGDRMRFDHGRGCWYVWQGTRWEADGTNAGFHAARMTCRHFGGGEERLAKASAAAGVERFCRADPVFAVTPDRWDQGLFLLGTPGGTVDLRTGELRPADRDQFITKLTAVAPAPPGTPHPLWSRFLAEATQGDAALQRFMQQICGYALTGDTREHALFFVYGDGGNGKGVFLNVVTTVMADYAATAAMDTFTASANDRHPTDLAMLRGARLVSASETEEGRAWAESLIKRLTGGDPITARFMRQDFFTFLPQFTLLIIGNHKPVLKNVDEAMRRRFNMIPFVHKPAEKDPQLGEKLVPEYPAILRWMIDGCLDWQANGLVRPPVVRDATEEYFSDQDLLGQWLTECCEEGGSFSESTRGLFDSWAKWAAEAGERPGTEVKLSAALMKRFRKVRHVPGRRGVRGFLGVRVRVVDTSDQWQNRLDGDD